jgi:hypothetical protein
MLMMLYLGDHGTYLFVFHIPDIEVFWVVLGKFYLSWIISYLR